MPAKRCPHHIFEAVRAIGSESEGFPDKGEFFACIHCGRAGVECPDCAGDGMTEDDEPCQSCAGEGIVPEPRRPESAWNRPIRT